MGLRHLPGTARSATEQWGSDAVNEDWSLDADAADNESLARLEQHLAALRDSRCVECRRTLCGHESLFSVAMGLTTKPRCVSCLATGLGMSAQGLRDHLWAHFQRRSCYGEVWRRVNEREGFPRLGLPACLWPDSGDRRRDRAPRGSGDQAVRCGAHPVDAGLRLRHVCRQPNCLRRSRRAETERAGRSQAAPDANGCDLTVGLTEYDLIDLQDIREASLLQGADRFVAFPVCLKVPR